MTDTLDRDILDAPPSPDEPMPDTLDRQQWLLERRAGVGASDVAGIMGRSPWASPYSIWTDKVGLAPLDDDPTDQMLWGQYAERAVVPWFETVTGLAVTGEQRVVVHSNGWARCTIDGEIPEADAVLEIKTTSDTADEWADTIPAHYQCQAQWSMWATGHPVCIFAVLHMGFGRVTFRTYQLHRDDAEIDRISTECRRFWHDHVLAGEPPATDGHKATTAALKLWEADDDLTVELDTPTVAALERLHNLKAQAKDLDADIAGCENTIKAALTTATHGVIAGRPAVTWKPQTSTRIDSKALRASHPEIADEFSTTTESRVLRLKTFTGKDDQP